MPRAAGDSAYYTWYLNKSDTLPSIMLPSVTHILNSIYGAHQGVVTWAYNRGRDGLSPPDVYREERRDQGTKAHDYFERLVVGKVKPVDDAEDPFERAANRWYARTKPLTIESETPVFSLKHMYAGTVDYIWDHKDGTYISDVKTGNANRRAYRSDKLQVAAYAIAYEEMVGIHIKKGSVIILKDNGSWSHATFNVDDYRDGWLRTLDLWLSLPGT